MIVKPHKAENSLFFSSECRELHLDGIENTNFSKLLYLINTFALMVACDVSIDVDMGIV